MPKHQGSMAYTRHKYIRSIPQPKIRRFVLGDKKGEYSYKVLLKAKHAARISSAALESTRVTANKILETSGKSYMLTILTYPHEVVREHKFMGFAGADRLSQGMKKAFGRPRKRVAQVNAEQSILAVSTNEDGIDVAKLAMKRASKKLPIPYYVVVKPIKQLNQKPNNSPIESL
jgi:large subunit ribosomal protein L10e